MYIFFYKNNKTERKNLPNVNKFINTQPPNVYLAEPLKKYDYCQVSQKQQNKPQIQIMHITNKVDYEHQESFNFRYLNRIILLIKNFIGFIGNTVRYQIMS